MSLYFAFVLAIFMAIVHSGSAGKSRLHFYVENRNGYLFVSTHACVHRANLHSLEPNVAVT